MNLNKYYKKLNSYYKKVESYNNKLTDSLREEPIKYPDIEYDKYLNQKMIHFHILWLIILFLVLTTCFIENICGMVLGMATGAFLTQTYFLTKCISKHRNLNKKLLALKLVK